MGDGERDDEGRREWEWMRLVRERARARRGTQHLARDLIAPHCPTVHIPLPFATIFNSFPSSLLHSLLHTLLAAPVGTLSFS